LFLFYQENKAFIVVGIEVAHLDRGLLLLPDPLPFPVEQFDLDVRVWKNVAATKNDSKTRT
jgi:hypothetical protein